MCEEPGSTDPGSFVLVAGARYEVQKTIRELEPEVLTVKFKVRDGKLLEPTCG
jgi:hypothetical protein